MWPPTLSAMVGLAARLWITPCNTHFAARCMMQAVFFFAQDEQEFGTDRIVSRKFVAGLAV